MRILIYTPMHPDYGIRPQTLDCLYALDHGGHQVNYWLHAGTQAYGHTYQNVTANYNAARQRVLDEGYDALLTVEADMLPPKDALLRLLAAGSDVAYGLYVFRQGHEWSACPRLGLFGVRSLSHDPHKARAAWGDTVDVRGLGLGCTLIRRRVLERFPFRLYEGDADDWLIDEYTPVVERVEAKYGMKIDLYSSHYGMAANDWLLGLDAQHYGFEQRCDTAVTCGHINNDRVLWPDPAAPELYREEPL